MKQNPNKNSLIASIIKQLKILGHGTNKLQMVLYRNKSFRVRLLGVTIDHNLNFISHIKEYCGKVYLKTSALTRVLGYISEKKAKLLLNAAVTSNLQYCSLIWLFCSKAVDNLINRTFKRVMRITYNSDSEDTLDALLQRDGALTIHKKFYKN